MAFMDVILGHQSYNDYISSQDQIKGFEKALVGKKSSLQIGLDQQDYRNALISGLGSISDNIARATYTISNTFEVGFDQISDGIDKLNSDFNFFMGDLIWKTELQNEILASILATLQKPLDTKAKELRNRAVYAYQNGWYKESLSDLLESEKKNYQDFTVHRTIATIYLYHIIDLNKAFEYFLKTAKYALPKDKRQSAEAYYFAGLVCGLQNKYLDAVENFKIAYELNPQFYDAYYKHSSISAILGNLSESISSLAIAIKGDPRYFERSRIDPSFDHYDKNVREKVNNLLNEIKNDTNKNALDKLNAARNYFFDLKLLCNEASNVRHTYREKILTFKERLNSAEDNYSKDSLVTCCVSIKDSEYIISNYNYLKNKCIKDMNESGDTSISLVGFALSNRGKYNQEVDALLSKAEQLITEAKALRGNNTVESYVESFKFSKKAYNDYCNQAEEIIRKIDNIRKEKQAKKEKINHRLDAGKISGLVGGNIFGLMGALAGCVSCVEKGDVNLLSGGIIGYIIGFILGFIFGFIRDDY